MHTHYIRNTFNVLLTLGLSAEDQKILEDSVHPFYTIRHLSTENHEELLTALNPDSSKALMLWLSDEAWESISDSKEIIDALSFLPSVLLISPHCPAPRLAAICEDNFQKILESPLEKNQINNLLTHVHSHLSNAYDMRTMTKEVLLMRELYNQKHDVLTFIFDSIKHLDTSSTIEELFENTRFSLETLFPLQSMHMGLWNPDSTHLTCYLGTKDADTSNPVWQEKILIALEKLPQFKQSKDIQNADYTISYSYVGNYHYCDLNPEQGSLLVFPLHLQNKSIGFLVLQVLGEIKSTKDISLALDITRSHLSLCLAQKLAETPTYHIMPQPSYPLVQHHTQQ